MRKHLLSFMGIAVLACLAMPASANVTLHPLFCDDMVLQQGMKVPVWGWADDGEQVSVTINGKTASAVAEGGKWMVELGKLKAGGPFEMKVLGNNTITLKNVLVGEVWVCSGQSNMQWSVRNSNNAEEEIKNADYPRIRLFSVPLTCSRLPQDNVDGKWSVCTPETIPDFTAVGYFFGRDLHKELNVPIGLINSSWGGSAAEAWTTRETLLGNPDLKHLVEQWDKRAKDADATWKDYIQQLDDWRQKALEREEKGERYSGPPQAPRYDNRHSNHRASGLYNAMIAPLVPYAIQGAIWYQGESNASRAYQYRTLFPAMITDWREQWDQGDFPFLWVQLANFNSNGTWAELREAQTMTLSLKNTGQAVITDVGHPTDIHPRDKQTVGYRLALAARKVAYGEKKLVYSGPMYKSMKAEDGKIRITFDCFGSELTAKGNEPVKGFIIAGADKEFVPAGARIEGNSVVVWSDAVKNPVAVRYAWEDNPDCNLFNKEGIPANSFRTDEWPGKTVDNK